MAHPPRLTLACLLLGFLLFVASSEANTCKSGCHGIQTTKAYQAGRTYTYHLEGRSDTSVTDTQEEATIKLNADVELAIQSDCIHQLRLKNVKINGASVSQAEIEAHALQFNYHNGHIDTEVCAEAGDTQAALNIKRAVISLFQDAIVQDGGSTTHHETDVFGGCPTDFTFSKNGESRTIKKHRNLEECSYRENVKQELISGSFNLNAGVKSTPLLAAEQSVEQQFNRGVLSKASSVETYKFKPFSNGDAGAKTVVETTLTFKGESGGSRPAPVSEPKSLIFEAPRQAVRSSAQDIRNALRAARESMPDAVTSGSASRFAELVKVLRRSSKNDIMSVYTSGPRAGPERNLFLDALFRTGSGEAAEVVVDLVKSRQISPHESITMIFYTSLLFVRQVSLSSVTAVTSLLDQPLPRIAYLGIGSLIGKYCQEHACENVPEVNAALAKLSSKLVKATTRFQEDVVISALKGLGNVRYLDDATLLKIAKIATDKSVHNRVRVAALEALPTRCSMKWKELLFPTLADRVEDSEIRIKTYLSLVACPCAHVANKLKEVLDKETVNQVGSFITSHLRNLRASTNPDKQAAKHHLGLIKPRTRFPEDFRKFSYNDELSYSIDAFGLGSSAESNVIYSQNSFVPRSASLNLTTEIFGHSFNFLELDARVENLDKLIEEYFGPKGALQPSNLKDVVLDGKKTVSGIYENIVSRFQKKVGRHARQASQKEIDDFSKKVHLPDTELDDDLEIDLSIKLFGAELAFLSYAGDKDKVTPTRFVNLVLHILENGVDKAKNFDYHLRNHLYFLDAELVYPTGLGFPLTLGVTGSSAVHLKTSGKIDLVAIYNNPDSASVQLALEPSASIEITGSLIVEGYGIESGFKVKTTLHTATAADVSLKLLEGNGIDVNIGIPKPKQEIINVVSEVLISTGPKGDVYVIPKFNKGKEHSDCFDQLAPIIGLTVCGKISYPYENLISVQKKALFPLSGPASFSVYIENNDAKNYHFKAYYNKQNPKARSVEILFETPNSRTDRRISLLVEGAIEPNKLVRVTFDSPFKKASAEGIIKNNNQEQSLTVTIRHDTNEYFVRAGIIASGNKYRPLLEYKVPEHVEKLAGVKNGVKATKHNGQQYTAGGVVEVRNQNGGKSYVLDKVSLVSNGQALITIDGTVATTTTGGNVDLKILSNDDTYLVKGSGAISRPLNFRTELSVVPGKNKEHGFSVLLESKGSEQSAEQTLVIVHGSDLNSQVNRLTVSGKHNFKYVSPQEFDFSTERKITYPALGLIVLVEGEATPKSVGYEVEFKYNEFNVGSELSAKTGRSHPGDYEVEFEAKLLSNSIELKTKRDIISDHKNKFETSLELHPGGKYELEALVEYDVKPESINTKVDAQLKVNGKKIGIDVSLEANPNKVSSHALVSAQNTKYVDFLLSLQRGNNPSGNLKLNLENYLTANGKFRYQKGSGDAQLEINIPKFNRKITGHGEVSIVGSKHIANVDISYDAAKDPKKRIKFSTDSDFTATSYDTKNVLEILDSKLEANSKGSIQGQIDNGRMNIDFDITFPGGRYIVGKGSRDVTNQNEVMNGKIDIELIDYVTKGGKKRKYIHHAEIHNLNIKALTFDAKHNIKFVNFNNEDVTVLLGLKNLPSGADKKSVEVKFDLSGSKIPSPLSLQVAFDHENDGAYGSGKIESSLGNNLSLKANGNFVRGNNVDKPCTAETVIDIKLPSEKLKSIKLELSDSILIPVEKGGLFEFIEKYQLTYNNDKTVKLDSHFRGVGVPDDSHNVEGSGKVTITLPSNIPVTAGYGYKHNPLRELKEAAASLNLNYGNKQTSLALDSTYNNKLSIVNVNIKAVTPIEKINNVDIKIQHKDSGTPGYHQVPSSGKTDLTIIADQVKYTFSSEVEISEEKFSHHVIVVSPQGKTEKITKVTKLGNNEFSGEWKWISPKGFINIDGHVKAASIDDFSFVGNFDSDQVKTRKIHAEIANKLAKGGKRIAISVSSEGKNIVTGSTNYNKHSEGGKTIVEGNGSLKIRDETKSSSFKYTHQRLLADIDGENGLATLLNINFGQSSIVGEFKSTDQEIYIFNSYCQQSADCAQFKLQSKVTSGELRRSQETTIEVDLRKFSIPYEFGLKSNQVADLKTGFDHTAILYLHSSKEKTQYSYQVYAHPTESGIVITLPSRELALIGSADVPKSKRSGAYRLDASLYLDRKNHPKEKTSLSVSGDVVIDKTSGSISGESKFTYPKQRKDFVVKGNIHVGGAHLLDGNVDIDVFEKKNQRISITAKLLKTQVNQGYNVTGNLEIKSQGQNLNVDLDQHLMLSSKEIGFGSLLSYTDDRRKPKSTGILFSANLQEAHLLIRSPDQEFVKADSRIDVTKNLQKIETDVLIFGKDPVVISLEVKDLNSFKYLYQLKNNPRNKLEASGRVVIGQLAELQADSFTNGGKKELFHLKLHLDDRRYLKPDFAFNKENIASVIDAYRTRVIEITKLGNEFVQSVLEEILDELKDLVQHLDKAKPNLKPLLEYYVSQLTQLKNELNVQVEGLKQLEDKLRAIFEGPITAFIEGIKKIYARFEELQKTYADVVERAIATYKEIIPELQKSYRAVIAAVTEILDESATVLTNFIKGVITLIDAHKNEFEQITVIATDLLKDILKIVWTATSKVQAESEEFITVLIAKLKALKIYELVQQKYKEISEHDISKTVIDVLDNTVRAVKEFLPSPALKDLLTSIHSYIVKHIKGEKVDDIQELKKLYAYLLQAVQSVLELLQSEANTNNIFDVLETKLPFDLSALSKLPGIATLKVSVLALLRNREWQTLAEAYYAYRPTLHPSDLIPPFSKFAVFVDGGHFFTFDGRHLTLPGKCSYVLAQDARDGNFSIVADFNNGKLSSVTITEPKESITIKSAGTILLNNKPTEFPANTKNLHASAYESATKVVSDYGVKLVCSRKAPLICSLHVSGFYHGRLRGLLGNGNNEPWDDFTLPSGQVSEREGEFGNAYKINAGCSNVEAVDHHSAGHHDAVCTEFFAGKSSLSPGFNYVSPAPYRQACDHAASAGAKKEGACLIATAYYLALREARISVNIPTSCGSCQVGGQKVDIGDSVSVQFPKQQADIVFVLEQATENAKIFPELIVPLIAAIKSELRGYGITDVHVGLIGFGDHLEDPQHYTTKGSLNIDGDVKNIKYADRIPSISLEEAKAGDAQTRLDFIVQKLEVEVGPFKLVAAYQEALGYNFRPGAARTIVGVMATPCEKSVLPISLQQLRLALGYKAYTDLGLTYHQIAGLDDILVSGKAAKNVVGFDADSVFTLADAKKNPVEGSTELKNKMVVTSGDVCASFAATSGGAAFSAHNFLEAKANQKKQFITVTGRRVVSSLVSTEIKEDCVCRQQFGLYPRTDCKIISRKEKELVRKGTKGTKG